MKTKEGIVAAALADVQGEDFDAYVAEVEAGLDLAGRQTLDLYRSQFALANQLVELRKSKKWSQDEVARRAHIEQSDVSRAERAIGNLSQAKLTRLGLAFGKVLGFVDPPRPQIA